MAFYTKDIISPTASFTNVTIDGGTLTIVNAPPASITASSAVHAQTASYSTTLGATLDTNIISPDTVALLASDGTLISFATVNQVASATNAYSSQITQQVGLGTIISSSIPYYITFLSGSPTLNGSVYVTESLTYIPSTNTINATSSYALTASYAMNGGGGATTLIDTIGARVYTDDTFITAGSKGYKHIAYSADIVKTRTIANTSGNIDINIKRNNVTLGTISLSNQSSSLDTTLTGWTTQLNTNDLIEFYVSQSSTYITDISIFIDIQSR